MPRACIDCPSPISRKSTTGRCRRCANVAKNSTPEMRAKVRETQLKLWQTPERRAKIVDNLGAWRTTPEGARRHAEMNRQKGRKRTEALLAWCPQERLKRYCALRDRLGAPEAKRRVLAEIAQAERDRLAAMTPFERQLEAVRNGARVVEKVRVPGREYGFSLTGCSAGML